MRSRFELESLATSLLNQLLEDITFADLEGLNYAEKFDAADLREAAKILNTAYANIITGWS